MKNNASQMLIYLGLVSRLVLADPIADAKFEKILIQDVASLAEEFSRLGKTSDEVLRDLHSGLWHPYHERLDIIRLVGDREIVAGAIDRNAAHFYGLTHRVSVALVFAKNERGQWDLLVQQFYGETFARRRLFCIAGHVGAGQGYEEAVRRELIEELELPEGHVLEGKLSRVGQEGQHANNGAKPKNQERLSIYSYFTSPGEALLLQRNATALDELKRRLPEAEFASHLKARQHDEDGVPTGRGEIWSGPHRISLRDLPRLAGEGIDVVGFAGPERIPFDPDLLHILNFSEIQSCLQTVLED